jgi:DNA polymerase III sliding clamp (beta) subunit (PCNA family)
LNLNFTLALDELRQATNFVRHGLGGVAEEHLGARLFLFDLRGQGTSKQPSPLLTIFASNGELLARASVPVQRGPTCTEDGSFAVLAKTFLELISSGIGSEWVTFSVDDQNVKIRARGFRGGLRVNFATYAVDFDARAIALRDAAAPPPAGVSTAGTSWRKGVLVAALTHAKTWGAVCDASRLDVNHTEYRNGRFISSDGKRILIYSPIGATKQDVGLKVPNTLLHRVIGALQDIPGDEVTVAEPSAIGRYYYISAGDRFMLRFRDIGKSFPDVEENYLSYPKSDADDVVRVERKYFENMVKAVSLGVDPDKEKSGSVFLYVAGTGAKASLTVVSENELDRVSFERVICGRKALDAISLKVKFKHLLDTLAVCKDQTIDIFIVRKKGVLLVRDSLPEREVLAVISFLCGATLQEKATEDQRAQYDEALKAEWATLLTAVEAELVEDEKESAARILAEQRNLAETTPVEVNQ